MTHVATLLEKASIKYARNDAFLCEGRSIQFRDVERLSDSFCAYLQNQCGVQKNDCVAVMLPESLHWPILAFAIAKAGALLAPIDVNMSPMEACERMAQCEAKILCCSQDEIKNLRGSLARTSVKTIITTKPGDLLYFPRSLYANFFTAQTLLQSLFSKSGNIQQVSFTEARKAGRNFPIFSVEHLPTDPFLYVDDHFLSHKEVLKKVSTLLKKMPKNIQLGNEIAASTLPAHEEHRVISLFSFFSSGVTQVLSQKKDLSSFAKHPLSVLQTTSLTEHANLHLKWILQ